MIGQRVKGSSYWEHKCTQMSLLQFANQIFIFLYKYKNICPNGAAIEKVIESSKQTSTVNLIEIVKIEIQPFGFEIPCGTKQLLCKSQVLPVKSQVRFQVKTINIQSQL